MTSQLRKILSIDEKGDEVKKTDGDVLQTSDVDADEARAPTAHAHGHGGGDGTPTLTAGKEAAILAERRQIEKSIKRKLDFGMLPIILLVYCLNYIDRNSISQARLSGLERDLKLTDAQYQTALALLYPLYITMQVPSNLMLAWCGRPSIYLGTWIILWGVVSGSTGAVHSYHQLAAVRVILGFTEAPFFPGVLFLLSKWYTRREIAVRTALFYAASIASNAFAGLISAGVLGNMEGVRGLAAWRWLFIIMGAITVGAGIGVIFLLPDFPHNTSKLWFTKEQLAVAEQRLKEDVGDVEDDGPAPTPFTGFIMAVKDIKVWILTIMLFAVTLGCSFNAFFPTLVATLGYPKIETLLITVPPWFVAFVAVYLNALHADRKGERFWHMTIPQVVGIVGFIIAAATKAVGARFFGIFVMASSYAGYVIVLSWASNTIPRPAYKRAAGLGMINCLSNLANLCGSFVWPKAWGPTYWRSYTIAACSFVVCIALGAVLKWHLTQLNKEMDRKQGPALPLPSADDEENAEPLTDAQRVERARLHFRYLV